MVFAISIRELPIPKRNTRHGGISFVSARTRREHSVRHFPQKMQYPSQEESGGPAAAHQRIGFWSANMRTGAVTWDNTAAAIHGMPPGHAPSLHEALGFFLPAERALVIQSALMALDSRTLFDIEASIQVGGRGITIRLIGGRGYDAREDGPEAARHHRETGGAGAPLH